MKTIIISAALAASLAYAQETATPAPASAPAPAPAPADQAPAPAPAPAAELDPAIAAQGQALQKQLIDALTNMKEVVSTIKDKATADAAAPKVAECCAAFADAAQRGSELVEQNPALVDYLTENPAIDQATLNELGQASIGQLFGIIMSGAYESEALVQATAPLLQAVMSEQDPGDISIEEDISEENIDAEEDDDSDDAGVFDDEDAPEDEDMSDIQ